MFHGLHDLSIQQSTALKSFVSGHDTFVSLPTGHGKPLIYQLAIPLMKELSKRSDELSFHIPLHPMLLVVSLLTSLINDQINSCERLGLKCCTLEDFFYFLFYLDRKFFIYILFIKEIWLNRK